MEWKEFQISEIATLINGRAYSQDELFEKGKYKIVRVGNLSGGNKWFFSDMELDADKYCYPNDLLFSWACNFGPHIWKNDKTIYHYHIWKVKEDSSKIDKYFFYYFLKYRTPYWLGNVNGSVMVHITKGTMEKQSIRIPVNLSDQRKIAGILSALDSKIENNNKINANLEAQAQALFKSWFVDFTPFKDQPFVDSELGPIPQGWKVGKLGDYCETICRGLTPKYNLDSKEIVLGQTCVRNNIVTLNNARKHQPKGKTEKKVQQWDTLINSTGIGSLGRVGIVYFDYNYVSFDSHITVVRATNPLLRPYIGRNLVSRQLEIENLAIGSTGQTELPRESVKSITLYIPTQKVLESFNCIIKPLSLKILKNIQENLRLAALRDTLLPKLMSGEIKL